MTVAITRTTQPVTVIILAGFFFSNAWCGWSDTGPGEGGNRVSGRAKAGNQAAATGSLPDGAAGSPEGAKPNTGSS